MDPVEIIAFISILLFSVIFHEVAHGLMAFRLGDTTARDAGRLTLNPLPHIDLFGSILLPALLYMSGLPVFGAAKPVPVNYNRLRDVKLGMLLISVVGPLTNLALAVIAGFVYRLAPNLSDTGESLVLLTMQLNLVLCFFNLIPVPPLDGSKILASIFGYFNHNLMYRFLELERFGFILVFVLILVPGILSAVLIPPVVAVMQFLTGIH